METILISNLKTHLNVKLKDVGKRIRYVVMKKDHPIAELVPYSEKKHLIIFALRN